MASRSRVSEPAIARELDARARQVGRRGHGAQALEGGVDRGLLERRAARQAVVGRRAEVLRQAQGHRGVALRVQVREQGLVAGLGDRGGDVHGGGGLAHPALLVRDCVDGAHAGEATGAIGRNPGWFAPNDRLLRGSHTFRKSPQAADDFPEGRALHRVGSGERPLARHPGPAREARRRWPDLAQHHQATGAGTGKRRDRDGPDRTPSPTDAPTDSSPASGSPFHATSTPSSPSRGAAYSASTPSGASARAVTAS